MVKTFRCPDGGLTITFSPPQHADVQIARRPVMVPIDPASNEVLAIVPMPDSGLPWTLTCGTARCG